MLACFTVSSAFCFSRYLSSGQRPNVETKELEPFKLPGKPGRKAGSVLYPNEGSKAWDVEGEWSKTMRTLLGSTTRTSDHSLCPEDIFTHATDVDDTCTTKTTISPEDITIY